MAKEKTIFSYLETYIGLYEVVSEGAKAPEEVAKYLRDSGRSRSNANKHVADAMQGNVPFIAYTDEKLRLDYTALSDELTFQFSKLNLEAHFTVVAKKAEEFIAGITSGHSPVFRGMHSEKNKANKSLKKMEALLQEKDQEIERLKKKLAEGTSAVILDEMNKKILVPSSVASEPSTVFANNFFYQASAGKVEVTKRVSKTGGESSGQYDTNVETEKELTYQNFFKRICEQFKSPDFFLKKIKDQKDKKESGAWVSPEEAKRIRAVQQLLANNEMDNQTKLSTYAFWYFHWDPEMEDLLNFAGENGIHANSVIQLLEKPEEYQNYRIMRGFLQQLRSASIAYQKQETVKELLCGDWLPVAEYCGKKCHFKLVPIEEISLFKECLEQSDVLGAIGVAENMLSYASGPVDQKPDGSEKEVKDIVSPTFIHSPEVDAALREKIDESKVLDDFAEGDGHEG